MEHDDTIVQDNGVYYGEPNDEPFDYSVDAMIALIDSEFTNVRHRAIFAGIITDSDEILAKIRAI